MPGYSIRNTAIPYLRISLVKKGDPPPAARQRQSPGHLWARCLAVPVVSMRVSLAPGRASTGLEVTSGIEQHIGPSQLSLVCSAAAGGELAV